MINIIKALVLIDGEHYMPVIKSAIETIVKELNYKVLAAIFLGGTEKSFGKEDFKLLGVPVVYHQTPLQSIMKALTEDDFQQFAVTDESVTFQISLCRIFWVGIKEMLAVLGENKQKGLVEGIPCPASKTGTVISIA